MNPRIIATASALFALIFLGLDPYAAQAQAQSCREEREDSAKKDNFIKRLLTEKKDNPDKKINYSFVIGPNYASDTKFGIGGVATARYYTKRDGSTSLSSTALFGNVATTGYYNIGIRGVNYFADDKIRQDNNIMFFSFPSDIWGFGYKNGDNDDNQSSYLQIQFSLKTDIMYRIAPYLYAGPYLEFTFNRGSRFDNKDFVAGLHRSTRSYGYGLSICYDTRDYIPNAYKGFYFKATQINYAEPSRKPYYKTIINSDWYKKVWKGGVFAIDWYSEFSYGEIPWTMLSKIGGSYRMRGYYEGRYRDKNMISLQAELRQKIYRRHGIAVWTGAGNTWGIDKYKNSHTLPNAGIGYRFELRGRTNIRLDFGIGQRWQTAVMFQIEEAF